VWNTSGRTGGEDGLEAKKGKDKGKAKEANGAKAPPAWDDMHKSKGGKGAPDRWTLDDDKLERTRNGRGNLQW